MITVSSLYQTLMSAERILRSAAPTPFATTSLGLSAVNVMTVISSVVMGRHALVSGVCMLPSTITYFRNLTWRFGSTVSH